MLDFLIVGSGLYGAVFAGRAAAVGHRCHILEKRPHIGGNAYTGEAAGITVHEYGAHIFHTGNAEVWDFMRKYADFNNYVNSPLANYRGAVYNLPFNMNTFNKLWGVVTPAEAKAEIDRQRAAHYTPEPQNLEQQAINLVGVEIYEKLIRGYTEKQWGRPCAELPAFIIRRVPLRFTYDNNYFNDPHQGIPTEGYTRMIEKIIGAVPVTLEADYLAQRQRWAGKARCVVFTGPIDAWFGYSLGALQYRSLRFEHAVLDEENHQGNAVVNYTDAETPYTRVIEHKHFVFGKQPKTVVSREYSQTWRPGDEPFYPVNDDANNALYRQYRALAEQTPGVIFGGRLGRYQYYDMDQVIAQALADSTPDKLAETLGAAR